MNFLCGVIEPGLGQHLAALDSLFLDAAQQAADVVARLALVEQLAEHLDARDDRLLRVSSKPMISTSSSTLIDAALDAARGHRAAALDREHVLDRHQERLVDVAHRLRDVACRARRAAR